MKRLPDYLLAPILEKNAAGMSYDQITQWVATEHGIAISKTSLMNSLAKVRKDRASLIRTTAQTELTLGVLADINILNDIQQLEQAAMWDALTPKERRAAETQLLKVIELKMKFCGLDTPEKPPEQIKQEAFEKLDRLLPPRNEPTED